MLLAVVVIGSVAGFAQNPVSANDGPPPGLQPRAWACYETCVLPSYIIADDFNQDSWLDFAVACGGSSQVFKYNNARAGGLFAPPIRYNVGGGPAALVSGHMDRPLQGFDGLPDIAVLSTTNLPGTSGIPSPCGIGWISATQPTGPWNGGIPGVTPPVTGLVHFAGGDFNADGRVDFAVVGRAPNQLYIFNSAPPAPYTPAGGNPYALGGTPVFVVTGDFDQNGWTDVAVVEQGSPGQIQVFYNTRTGLVAGPAVPLFVPLVPTGMDVGDFNADGYPDLVVVGNIPDQDPNLNGYAQVFLNTVPLTGGVGFASNAVMKTWGFNARFVEVADFDGNGRDDFAVANKGSDTVTIFLTDGLSLGPDKRPTVPKYCLCKDQMKKDLLNITFKLFKIELQCGHFPIGLAAGDFDRNGKIDLAVALQSADKDLCAQNNSCIEIDFDIACGFNANQKTHAQIIQSEKLQGKESQQCGACKGTPCTGNTPPKPEIQTGSDTKK